MAITTINVFCLLVFFALFEFFSFISSNTLIGSPAHVYTYGYMLTFQGVGFVAATFIALIFLLPIYERLQVSNSYKVGENNLL